MYHYFVIKVEICTVIKDKTNFLAFLSVLWSRLEYVTVSRPRLPVNSLKPYRSYRTKFTSEFPKTIPIVLSLVNSQQYWTV